ncbi:MAG TPA: RHS domain-containing protein [Bacillota bacterium]|nr:RHS domain-containing protein [Bacillota bacterium]
MDILLCLSLEWEEENRNYLEYIYVLGKHFARLDGNLDNLNDTTKYFYHTDHLGSTVADTDRAGDTVWDGEYTPFGKQVG